MIVLAVDPGKVSGVTMWCTDNPLSIGTFELSMYDTIALIKQVVEDPNFQMHDIVVVTERFTISERTIKTALSLDALDINGWLTVEKDFMTFDLVFQTPAQAKKFSTDEKLKALGWYHPTKDGHQNDSTRHLLVYLLRHVPEARDLIVPIIAKEVLP